MKWIWVEGSKQNPDTSESNAAAAISEAAALRMSYRQCTLAR